MSGGIEPALRRIPAPFTDEHPLAEYARWRGAAIITEREAGEWMRTRDVLDAISAPWRTAHPLMQWIASYVA